MRMMLTLLIMGIGFAAPAAPEIIVNNQTMECSDYNAGDECTSCEIPAGWASLGLDVQECPEEYSKVAADRNCTPARNERCCSEGHSGSPGDCDGMAVNHLLKQCMFADGAAPAGWETKPDGTDARDWQCPEGYGWREEGAQGGGPCAAGLILCGFASLIIIRRS